MSGVSYIDTTLRDLATYPWGSNIDADDLARFATHCREELDVLGEIV